MPQAIVRYIHRISPRDTDRAGPFPVAGYELADAESARRWLRKHTGEYPRLKHARRTDDGFGWVFFPPDRCGNWHSISIQPGHGTERNRREETEHGPEVDMRDTEGNLVYRGPGSSVTLTVVEKWCADCQKWVEIRGILGHVFGCNVCGKEW